MKFGQSAVRQGLWSFVISVFSTTVLIGAITIVVGETRFNDAVSLNLWLARDVASQFSSFAARELARAQKYGEMVKRESGTFENEAQRMFRLDSSLQGLWVIDAPGSGPLQPLAKLERDDFSLTETQVETIRRLIDVAIQNGSAARGVSTGINAIALKLGDMPRTVVLFSDQSLFSRVAGGPWGEKWMLIAPSQDRTEALLGEATSELQAGTQYPAFDDVVRLMSAQNPAQERNEFSSELTIPSGDTFQVSGIQTGFFGVVAVAVSPLSSLFARSDLLLKIAFGISISIGFLVALIVLIYHSIRLRRTTR